MCKKPHNKAFILFSGFNPRAVVTLCRIFSKYSIPFYIVALDQEDPITLTSYLPHIKWVRKKRQLDLDEFIESIEWIRLNYNLDEAYVVPSTEALNRFMLAHREYLENHNIIVPLVDKPLYELISNKYSFGELCTQSGLQVPKEVDIEINEVYPIVAKPKGYLAGRSLSPVIIKDSSNLDTFKKTYDINDFYFQEYIYGESYYLLYSFDKEGNSVAFSQQNYMQQGNGKSIVFAESSNIHNEEIGILYKNLFENLNYFGVVMVEIRKSNSAFYMIEANPRFWGPLQLTYDCSVPIVEKWIQMLGFDLDIENNKPVKEGKYFWLAGLLNALKNNNVMYHVEGNCISSLEEYIPIDLFFREDSRKYFYHENKGQLDNENGLLPIEKSLPGRI